MTTLPFVQSFSSRNTFTTCPRKYQAQYVTKETVWKPSAARDFGTFLHAVAEGYINAHTTGSIFDRGAYIFPLPEATYDAIAASLNLTYTPTRTELQPHWHAAHTALSCIPLTPDARFEAELKLAVNGDMVGCGYYDKTGVARSIIDVVVLLGDVAIALDWKSGKTVKDTGQLADSAMMIMLNFPKVQTVHTAYVSTRGLAAIKKSYTRADIRDVWNRLQDDLRALRTAYATNVWRSKPNGLCREYCDVLACSHCGAGSK